MINILDKHLCCGCGACFQKCPQQCISLRYDVEGFLYPNVNKDSCIDCGLCQKVCPMLNPFKARKPLNAIAAINREEKIRLESSSGGVFTLLAELIINEGGVVFGARYDGEWQVVLDYTESINGLAAFRGSKYVQARTGNTYVLCEKFLKEGRMVLYTATPCQIAGLKHFLGKEYDNLLTVDLGCHGVPSPKVWKSYLNEVIGAISNTHGVFSRGQYRVLQHLAFTITYRESDETILLSMPFYKNDYMHAFLKDMILRLSCYKCAAKEFKSGSDITIADYWGIRSVAPDMDDDGGTGLVFINSTKGRDFFRKIELKQIETTFEESIRCNPSIMNSAKPWYRRESFFSKLNDIDSVVSLIRKELKPPFKTRIIGKIKTLILLLLRIPKSLMKRDVRRPFGDENAMLIKNIDQLNEIISHRNVVLSRCDFRDKSVGWTTYNVTFTFKLQ